MQTNWQDLKHTIRGLRRSPGFTAAVVFALALGIGSNAVIFSAIHAVLLNPLPFRKLRDPERLVMIWERNPSMSAFFAERLPVRLRNFRTWKEQARSFDDLGVWADTSFTLTANDDRSGLKPEQVETGIASANFFPLLGVRLQMGRNFFADEMQAGRGQVAILSDELYKSRFGNDPKILEKVLTANGKQYRIVGVLPPGFEMPSFWEGFDQKKPRLWIPVELHPAMELDEHFGYFVFGRLRAGVRISEARSEMKVIAQRLAAARPDTNTGCGINVFPLDEENAGPDLRRALLVLQAAVAFVLLIACANAGNLVLTRALERDKEIAVRTALGASRWSIVRQAFTESLVLSSLAAGVGLLIAFWAQMLFIKFAPEDVHGLQDIRIDGVVAAFAVGVSLAAAMLSVLFPAIHAWKEDIHEVLSRNARSMSGSSRRLRSALAAAEIGLSLVVLTGAGLMLRTLHSLMSTDLGFRPDHLLVMRVKLPEQKYKSPEMAMAFNSRLLDAVRNVAGVRNAALTNALPMKSVNQSSFEFPGVSYKPGTNPVANWSRSSDGYFETLGLRVLRGTTFTRQETTSNDPDVAVVNEAFVRTFFRNQDALGKALLFDNEAGKKTKYSIVGIVANERQMGPDREQSPQFYLPGNQLRSIILFARTVGDPLSVAPAVKQQVWNIEKEQPISDVVTADTILRNWTAPRRFNMVILLSFGGVALVLATVGLYSVLAYSVTLRRREIGIRMALGAEPNMVARFVLKQGLIMALTGIAVGLCGALVLTRFMRSLISGVSTSDPVTLGAVCVLLVMISMAACYLPALRAARVDPIEALRAE
jgi:predicted permease